MYCRSCGYQGEHAFSWESRPHCPQGCGPMRVDFSTWGHGPATDVYGSEQVSRVLEDEHGRPLRYTSTTDRDAQMRRMGFYPVGDKVRGSRDWTPRMPRKPRKEAPFRWGEHEHGRDHSAA